jgi:hypothetical protein
MWCSYTKTRAAITAKKERGVDSSGRREHAQKARTCRKAQKFNMKEGMLGVSKKKKKLVV